MDLDRIRPGRELSPADTVGSIRAGDQLPVSPQLSVSPDAKFVEVVTRVFSAPTRFQNLAPGSVLGIDTVVRSGNERYPTNTRRTFYRGADEPVPYAGSTPHLFPRASTPTDWTLRSPSSPEPTALTVRPGDVLPPYLGTTDDLMREQGDDYDIDIYNEVYAVETLCGKQRISSIRQDGDRVRLFCTDLGPPISALRYAASLLPDPIYLGDDPNAFDYLTSNERAVIVDALYEFVSENVSIPRDRLPVRSSHRIYVANENDPIRFPYYAAPSHTDPVARLRNRSYQFVFAKPFVYVNPRGALLRFYRHPTGRGRWPTWVPQYDATAPPLFETDPSTGLHIPVVSDVRYARHKRKELFRVMTPEVYKSLIDRAPASHRTIRNEVTSGWAQMKDGYKQWLSIHSIVISEEAVNESVNRMIVHAYEEMYRLMEEVENG